MEIEILAIACFVTMAIIFFLLGTKELLKKDINIDQLFYYDGYMVITDNQKKEHHTE